MSIDPKTIKGATYKGKIEALRGKRALIRPGPLHETGKCVYAQFDEQELMLGDKRLDIGWHVMPLDSFDVDLEFHAD